MEPSLIKETRTVSQITKGTTPCPALRIIFSEIVWSGIILLHAHPQVVYYNCAVSPVSVYSFRKSCDYKTCRQTDGLVISFIPHKQMWVKTG